MTIVDKVLDIIENDLNIKISKKKKQIIYDKFYPDIKDKIYWSYRIEKSFYEGIISKEEYEKIKTLPPKTDIYFGEIAKYVYDDGILENFPFTEDKNEIRKYKAKNPTMSNTEIANHFGVHKNTIQIATVGMEGRKK